MRNNLFALTIALLFVNVSHGAFMQLLTNRGFENAAPSGSHMQGWTVNGATAPPNPGPIQIKEYPSSFWSPGPVPDGNGSWGLEIAQNAAGNPPGNAQSNAQQNVPVTPGLYAVSASVWARVWDNSGGFSRARFRLLVDGGTQQEIDLVNNGTNPGPDGPAKWTPWTNLQTTTHLVNVTSTLGVFLQMRADGVGGTAAWGQTVADSFRLDAELQTVPNVTNAEYSGINANDPGGVSHSFVAVDDNVFGAGPFTWDQFQLLSYTPNYGGDPSPAGIANGLAQAAVGVESFLTSGGAFSWDSIGAPRGDYVWRVRATDTTNLSNTGTITVHVTGVPEPATIVLCGLALLGFAAVRRSH